MIGFFRTNRYLPIPALAILVLTGAAMRPSPSVAGNTICIVSGAEGGLYHLFASELAACLTAELSPEYTFEVVQTAGSTDNIERLLLDPRVGIALAQEDVAHFYYTGANNDYFTIPRSDDYRLTCLGRIFCEQLYFVGLPGFVWVTSVSHDLLTHAG